MPKNETPTITEGQLEAKIAEADKYMRTLIKALSEWDDYRFSLINWPKRIGTTPPGPHPKRPPGL